MELKWVSKEELYKIFESDKNRKDLTDKKFKYLDLSYFGIGQDTILIALDGENPVGVLQMGISPSDSKQYWMKFVTVHPDYRNQGVAKSLITEMFNFVSKIEDGKIDLSTYEESGEVMIGMVQEVSSKFPELLVRHRVWGGPYQDTKKHFFREGEVVRVEYENYVGVGTIKYFQEFKDYIKVGILTKEETHIDCTLNDLKSL